MNDARIVNIAAYRFAPLNDLRNRREVLLRHCRGAGLKGTILLSPEGINLFVAGDEASIDGLLGLLRAIPGLEMLEPKVSHTDHQPFTRMLVRLKKEIIAFGVEGIAPGTVTSPKLPPKTLKQWLDEGRDVLLLDTRNDYEVKLGTFRGAQPIGIDHFRDFPAAVRKLPDEWKERPIVMFCTGGIRCEKAGPFMEREGFREIFQLDGGILKYFEECGGAHYDGECFVFDQRVGVDPSLHETRSAQCYRCQSPLTAEEQNDERYVPGESCPFCFRTPAERMVETVARREQAIRRHSTPLPGREPCTNERPVTVPASADGLTVPEMFAQVVRHISAGEWTTACEEGRIWDAERRTVASTHTVRAGERYFHVTEGAVEPDVNANIRILHEDEALIVLNKPAPLPMHPGGRYHRNTLQHFLQAAYAPQKPRPAHRLDANTTGVVLVTRTRHFAARLQPQFESGEVEKTYLVRVHGHPAADEFCCDARIGSEPGASGSRKIDSSQGLPALTEFRVLQRAADGTAFLEARPRTGRTNQIRLHLRHLGWAVCGDPLYSNQSLAAPPATLGLNDPPLCLHAWQVTIRHPVTGERTTFTAPPPGWLSPA
ncbi:MAG: RluA family pseudouridine synthase [Terrimicrobiaceae bacterium]|nr:RluA family pseudouridine synthase [Terrimicrobiaceae bacterium]